MNYLPSVTQMPLEVGQQLTFAGDPHPWTVKAISENFAALTRPVVADDCDDYRREDWAEFHSGDLEDGTLYTVLDWRNGVRGPCNLVGQGWGDGTYTEAECAAMLAEFESGELEVSHRNRVRIKFGEVAW
ncbi:hypothetical protein Ade02nite_21210 [Paractinoplanes deccanensis]|uniref:Uncharacterized protein n=1 Tax=Paractinoplanes deccanensis TaxID=113561 RepID=A0ABQ3Y0H3_9ACTN|nr:hypothetical protein [Actinoplanes deccanensis]GID73480.1 hypothetical protein Ade02nite_21210 [Actinoplanes deccanensis]